ncbi:conserved hypothetical protein [Verticillium alfalfae VaMs.102]|uniref:Aminoglycoside phosphotransferase domain-containing protein n=1 Tax=Verticillium alfalfae (strain VaMs.102 / ATCC MYA-4576 / FGSC 10136) TaxID=526221 RepID=C9SMY6_VERA1|nr:conserved hypothetical protein [Verticillium alfalfae VaMs.102]EEY20151.1 conserved hypothetical protein [Verticillium alfalfae VaMs.102]
MTIQLPSRITFEGPDTVRKWGDAVRLRREVEAMTFVQRETSVPVPTILEVYFDDQSNEDKCWILMERLSYLEQLHHLRLADAGVIGSVSGGAAFDHRLSNMHTRGPFASVADFHDFLVAPVKQSPRPGTFAKYRAQFPGTYEIRFAHAELSWENILVDASTGKITGILDWEMAGFWPEWWEYRKALFGSRSQPWWIQVLKPSHDGVRTRNRN